MNEEFAIQLKVILNQSSIAQTKEQLNKFKESIESNITNAMSAATSAKSNIDLSEYEAVEGHAKEIELILQKIADKQTLLSSGILKSHEIAETEAEIEKLENRLHKLLEVKEEVEDTEEAKKIIANTDGIVKGVKSVLLGLIGVRGVYSSIRRAMSAYLAQNDELKSKINACWYALGSLFAPVVEYIVNLFVKLVSIINAVVKALGFAGINMSKYGKAGAKAAKQLAPFDEINNLSDSGGGGASNPFGNFDLGDKFKDFEALIKGNIELLKLIGIGAMFGIGVALLFTGHPMIGLGMILASGVLAYKTISENWDYITEKVGGVKNAIMALVAGFAIGLGLILLMSPATLGFGLALLLAGVSVAAIQIDWSFLSKKVRETISDITFIIGLSMLAIGFIIAMFNPAVGLGMMIAGGLMSYASSASISEGALSDYAEEELDTTEKTVDEGMSSIQASMLDSLKQMKTDNKDMWGSLDGFADSGLEAILKSLSSFFSSMKQKVQKEIKDTINKYVVDPINKVISWINEKLNFSFGGLTIAGEQVIKPFNFQLFKLKSIPQLDFGTNYVPNDMLAMIHQGEAVVPKKFNQNDMYGQVSEEELNLLSSINEQLIELNRKETTINLDGTNIAERINNKIQDLNYRNGERVFAVAR